MELRKKREYKIKNIVAVRDRPIKSILKAISWRIIASTTTFFLAYMFFSDDPKATEKATGVALAEASVKILLFFFHERAWTSVRWGRMKVIIRRNSILRRKIVKRIKFNAATWINML